MCRLALAVGTAIALGVAGCSSPATTSAAATTMTVTESAAGSTGDTVVTETVTSTVTVTAAPDIPAPSPEASTSALSNELGTRDDPAPVGTKAEFDNDWEVTFDDTDLDAWPEIEKDSRLAEAPPDGEVYVSAPVHVTYNGDGSEDPGYGLQYAFVGSKGNVFDPIDHSCGFGGPNGFHEVGELFAGASGTGTVCASVPKDQLAGGEWRVQYFSTRTLDQVEGFFALS